MTFSTDIFKQQFPLFSQAENNALVYLDNAATTQKPQCVIDAITQFYLHNNGNANRASHRLARQATTIVDTVREKAACFIGSPDKRTIVFTTGATQGLNIIANSFRYLLNANHEILLSVVEHHANLVPWQEVGKFSGARLVIADYNIGHIHQHINSNTKIICLSIASNGLGQYLDLSQIKHLKKDYPDIILVIDASQWVAHKSIDVMDWGCDFLVFSAHKCYGPTGIGVLYGRYDLLNACTPHSYGGEMIEAVYSDYSIYGLAPERFEAGTSSLAAIAGFGACLDFWAQQNRASMLSYETTLVAELHNKLRLLISQYPYLELLTTEDNNVGIATLASETVSMADMAHWLDEYDIAVRVGDHCVQPLWRKMGVFNPLRISLAAYNTFDDINVLINAMTEFLIANSPDSDSIDRQQGYASINVDELLSLKPWQKKYKKIMEWGSLTFCDKNIRYSENLIKSCEAPLWLNAMVCNERYYFYLDSDSRLVKGLAALILSQCEGKKLSQIKSLDFETLLADLGLSKHLSSSRLNGLRGLIARIRGE